MDLLLLLGLVALIGDAVYMVFLWVVQTVRRINLWFYAKKARLVAKMRPKRQRRPVDGRRVMIKINRRDV